MSNKMHANEVHSDVLLVHRLLRAQFPHWADLPIKSVRSAGTDNAIYQLGDDMAVRVPRTPGAVRQVDKEQYWLSRLAPFLPLAIPVPLAKGAPSEDYPWHWSVSPWLEGENATLDRIADPSQAAIDLAHFITALQEIDATDGPLAGLHNFFRGVPLVQLDAKTREAIAALNGKIDTDAATMAWEAALQTSVWDKQPVWIHGDLQSGNLLAVAGQLNAVIDFGGLGVGDPACDLLVAWSLFSAEMRDTFRTTLSADDATWARGRGWALYFGLVALPYYKDTNPVLADIARYAIKEVLEDHK